MNIEERKEEPFLSLKKKLVFMVVCTENRNLVTNVVEHTSRKMHVPKFVDVADFKNLHELYFLGPSSQ